MNYNSIQTLIALIQQKWYHIFFTLEFIKIDYGTTNISSLASGGFTERFGEGKM